MPLLIQYEIVQQYEDEAPEAFGYEYFGADRVPSVGDTIMLHWLDGRDAYPVKVVGKAECKLIVTAVTKD